ncbi:MAG: autotransporter-associated beta strand repeat-containing protein [Hyphomicrobiales bacterium]
MVDTVRTWANTGTDYNTGANWIGNVVPDSLDTAQFLSSASNLNVTFSLASTTASLWNFDALLANYNFAIGSGQSLTLTNGLTITSGEVQIDVAGSFFVTNGTLSTASIELASGALLQFGNQTTAGDAEIINNGSVIFSDSSSAGNANITNNSGQFLKFIVDADAGTSTIDNNDYVQFYDTASASGADITNKFLVQFFNSSTAGSSTINSSVSGSGIYFNDQSTGGDSELIAASGAFVDFSTSTGVGGGGTISAGSIAGDGDFYLGGLELTVGSNNLNTSVNGGIHDGGTGGGTGASLIKVGTGLLRLSGTNDYTGGTTIDGGTVQVEAGSALLGATQINSGGTLAGNGTVHAVNVAAGGTLSPGASAGQLHTDDLTFAAGAHFKAEIGGTTPGTEHDQLVVTGSVDLGWRHLGRPHQRLRSEQHSRTGICRHHRQRRQFAPSPELRRPRSRRKVPHRRPLLHHRL